MTAFERLTAALDDLDNAVASLPIVHNPINEGVSDEQLDAATARIEAAIALMDGRIVLDSAVTTNTASKTVDPSTMPT